MNSTGAFTPPGARSRPLEKLPSFCAVKGVLKPTPTSAIQFEVWLPESGWNGKLQVVGNGGLAGTISYPAMADALRDGFADGQHRHRTHLDGAVDVARGSRTADRLQLSRSSSDDGECEGDSAGVLHAAGEVRVLQRLLHRRQTGTDGGAAVSRPTSTASSPATPPTSGRTRWPARSGTASSRARPRRNLPKEKLQLVQDRAIAACDMLDGAADGLVSNPIKCHFDPGTLQCSGADSPNCLTKGQVEAVRERLRRSEESADRQDGLSRACIRAEKWAGPAAW